jgi:hypothetical protein
VEVLNYANIIKEKHIVWNVEVEQCVNTEKYEVIVEIVVVIRFVIIIYINILVKNVEVLNGVFMINKNNIVKYAMENIYVKINGVKPQEI